jgi:hypothetical protein
MLEARGYQTLVLPMSLALSDREIEAIRDFVSRGGTVIADALTGVMDERSAFRETRPMTELFGIESDAVTPEMIVAMEGEPGLRLRSSRSLEPSTDKPTLIHNRVGKGNTYLLNYFLDGYPEDKLEGREQPDLERLKKVLTAAGINPKIHLSSLRGEPVSGCARYLFQSGSTQLFGLVPDKDRDGNQQIRISLEGNKTVYDVRRSRYVTTGESFVDEIEPAVPELFAFVDGRVEALGLEAPEESRLGAEVSIELRVSGVEKYRSVATVKVIDPEGREVDVYGGNVDIIDGIGNVSFRTALNDRVGSWKVWVKDTVSGVEGQASMLIEAGR